MARSFVVALTTVGVLACGETSGSIGRLQPQDGGASDGRSGPMRADAGSHPGGSGGQVGSGGATAVSGQPGAGGDLSVAHTDSGASRADATFDASGGFPSEVDSAPESGVDGSDASNGDACHPLGKSACASAPACQWYLHLADPNGLPPVDGCYSKCATRATCPLGSGCEDVWVPNSCDGCPGCSGSVVAACVPLRALPSACRSATAACGGTTTQVCMRHHPVPCPCGDICDETTVRLCVVDPNGTLYTIGASEFEELELAVGWTHSAEKYLPSDLSTQEEERCAAALRQQPICP